MHERDHAHATAESSVARDDDRDAAPDRRSSMFNAPEIPLLSGLLGKTPPPPPPPPVPPTADWTNRPPMLVELDEVPTPTNFVPAWDARDRSRYPEHVAAFQSIAASTNDTWGSVIANVAALKSLAAETELALGTALGGKLASLDSFVAEDSDHSVASAFKQHRGDDKKSVATKKLSRADRVAVTQAKRKVANAESGVARAALEVGARASNVEGALANASRATRQLTISRNDTDAAEQEKSKTGVENDKAQVNNVINLIKAQIGVVKGLVKASSSEKPGDAVGGVLDAVDSTVSIVSNTVNVFFDKEINGAKTKVAQLKLTNARLAEQATVDGFMSAVAGVNAAMETLEAGNRAHHEALTTRTAAYADLSLLMESTAEKNKASPETSSRVQSIVAAVPFVEDVLGKLAAIKAVRAPGYEPLAGGGAATALNLSEFLDLHSTLRGYPVAAEAEEKKWMKRLLDAKALIAAAK